VQTISKFSGTRGILKTWHFALRWSYMISKQAKYRMKVLAHWQKYGIESAIDAFELKRRTLFNWKKALKEGKGKFEALNPRSKAPKHRRRRIWDYCILDELKRIRKEYPNLGAEKVYPLLKKYCDQNKLACPSATTIKRLIKDLGGLRISPQKVSHFGKVKSLKRKKVLRKPKNLKAEYPGHVVALDTIERFVHGMRRYIITFEDIHTRFAFAWSTKSHASLAAKEFFGLCLKVFPYPITFVLTDNGSEFAKHFSASLLDLHMTHYHTYPRTPKMNAHVERFNRTIQENFVDYHIHQLMYPDIFNTELMDWLVFYNTERVHHAFKNKLSPVQYMLSLDQQTNSSGKCKSGW
jgi:transposase InsO family protein